MNSGNDFTKHIHVKNIIRLLSILLMVFFFVPSFMVSCAGYGNIKISAFKAMTDKIAAIASGSCAVVDFIFWIALCVGVNKEATDITVQQKLQPDLYLISYLFWQL